MHKRLAVLIIALLLASGAACSGDDDSDDGGGGGETTTTATGDEGGDPDGTTPTTGDEGGSADPDGGDEAAPEDSLGTATADLRADPNDEATVPLRLDVVALDRLDGMVELRVVLTHEGRGDDPPFAPYDAFRDPRLGGSDGQHSLSGVQLIDGDAERAYLTVIDSEGVCLCTGDLDSLTLAPGDSTEMYADFGGVPDDLDQVSVQVPGFRTISPVPVGG